MSNEFLFDPDSTLKTIRQKIDRIDAQLQTLINERAQCAIEVAKTKQQNHTQPVYYRPEREAQILQSILQRASGPLPAKDVADIFLLIMGKCRALQKPIKIAISTKKATKNNLSMQAALQHFGRAIKTKSCASIHNIFQAVAKKEVNYGIIPIEDSMQGVVNESLTALAAFSLQICSEIELSVPVKNKANQAIRFLLIGQDKAAPSGCDKTSLLISISNQPGALAKIFQPFANYNINIVFIAPHLNQLWNYAFFVDIEGHQQDEQVKKALAELSQQPLSYSILGSYPKAVL